jgi:hypothetical protein
MNDKQEVIKIINNSLIEFSKYILSTDEKLSLSNIILSEKEEQLFSLVHFEREHEYYCDFKPDGVGVKIIDQEGFNFTSDELYTLTLNLFKDLSKLPFELERLDFIVRDDKYANVEIVREKENIVFIW